MKHPLPWIAALLFAAAPLAAASQMAPTHRGDEPMTPSAMKPMHATHHAAHMMGEHNMPGTVTHVDHKTGIVELTSLGMKLRVHFPPPTITRLKAGDKILLHLGYRIRH